MLALLRCSELRAELQPLIVVASTTTTVGITVTIATVIIVAIFSRMIFTLLQLALTLCHPRHGAGEEEPGADEFRDCAARLMVKAHKAQAHRG